MVFIRSKIWKIFQYLEKIVIFNHEKDKDPQYEICDGFLH